MSLFTLKFTSHSTSAHWIGNEKLTKSVIFFLRFYLFIFREKEKERNIHVWLPLVCPLLETWPTIQVCALTRNGTGDPLVSRPALDPQNHTSQGQSVVF